MAQLDCFSSPLTSLFGTPAASSLSWMDANIRLIETWLEWQRAMWQPLLDWQTAYAVQWLDQLGVPAGGVFMRGSEQLA